MIAAPATLSTWMLGTEWKSAFSDCPGEVLARIMPIPSASATAALLSVRATVPRSQITMLPAMTAGSSVD